MNVPATFELFGSIQIEFESMEDLSLGTFCGGYTNSFKYISGPAYDGSDPYNADLSQFVFE